MATQLPTSYPPGWNSGYDGATEKWYFIYQPTGFKQFHFPKAGDELNQPPGLAQPQASLAAGMEAMSISKTPQQTMTTATNSQQVTAAPRFAPTSKGPEREPASLPQQDGQQQRMPLQSIRHQSSTPQTLQQKQQQQQQQPSGSVLSPTPSPRPSPKHKHQIPSQVSHYQTPSPRSSPRQYSQQPIPANISQPQSQIQGPNSVSQPRQQRQQAFNSQNSTQDAKNVQQAQQSQQLSQVQQFKRLQATRQPQQAQQTQQTQQYPQSQQLRHAQQQQRPLQTQQLQQQQQPHQVQQPLKSQIQATYTTTSAQRSTTSLNASQAVDHRRYSTIPVQRQLGNVQANNSPPQGYQHIVSTRHSSIATSIAQPQPQIQNGNNQRQQAAVSHTQISLPAPEGQGHSIIWPDAQNASISSPNLQGNSFSNTPQGQMPLNFSSPTQDASGKVLSSSGGTRNALGHVQAPSVPSSSLIPQNYSYSPPVSQSDSSQRLGQQSIQQGFDQTSPAVSSVQTQVPQQYSQVYQHPQSVSPSQVQLQQAIAQVSSTAFQGQQIQELFKAQPVPIAQGMPTTGPQLTQQAHIGDTQAQPQPKMQYVHQGVQQDAQPGIGPTGPQRNQQQNQTQSQPLPVSPAGVQLEKPGLVERAIQMPKQVVHKSLEYIKDHPGQTKVLVTGAVIAADVFGVKISSDIATASKLCADIQSAQQHKQNAQGAAQGSVTMKIENAAPTQQSIPQIVQQLPQILQHIPQHQSTNVSPNPPIVSNSAKQAFHQLGHPNSQQGHTHHNPYQQNAQPGTILQQTANQQNQFPQSPPQYPPQQSLLTQLTPQLDCSQQSTLMANTSGQFSQAQYCQPQDPTQPQDFPQTYNYPGDQPGQFSLQQIYSDPSTCNYDTMSNIQPFDQSNIAAQPQSPFNPSLDSQSSQQQQDQDSYQALQPQGQLSEQQQLYPDQFTSSFNQLSQQQQQYSDPPVALFDQSLQQQQQYPDQSASIIDQTSQQQKQYLQDQASSVMTQPAQDQSQQLFADINMQLWEPLDQSIENGNSFMGNTTSNSLSQTQTPQPPDGGTLPDPSSFWDSQATSVDQELGFNSVDLSNIGNDAGNSMFGADDGIDDYGNGYGDDATSMDVQDQQQDYLYECSALMDPGFGEPDPSELNIG